MSAHKYSEPLYSPFKQQMRFQERKEECELLLEFQLKRQIQKNMILEQRLRNKQMFIQQMKMFNQDITTTFQKCQDQLNMCRAELNHIKNFEIRDHLQQIAHLKHHIKKLEQENKRLAHSQGTIVYPNSQTQRNMPERNSRMKMKGRVYSYGSQKQSPRSKKSKSRASHISGYKQSEQKQQNQKKLIIRGYKQSEKRQYNEEKLMNFVNQFLKMASNYVDINQSEKLTSKLKIAWKWIKNIVKQWHQKKDTLEDHWQFIQSLQKVLKVQNRGRQTELDLDQILNIITQMVQARSN